MLQKELYCPAHPLAGSTRKVVLLALTADQSDKVAVGQSVLVRVPW
jgi:hypothetical protein